MTGKFDSKKPAKRPAFLYSILLRNNSNVLERKNPLCLLTKGVFFRYNFWHRQAVFGPTVCEYMRDKLTYPASWNKYKPLW